MRTVRDRLSVAQTTIVGSHVRVSPGAATENYPDTARMGRVLVTLTMNALAPLCVAPMPAIMQALAFGTVAVNNALRQEFIMA